MITSTSNRLIKRVRKLEQKKFRTKEECGFVEGLRGVLTAAEYSQPLLETVIIAPDLITKSQGVTRLHDLVDPSQIVQVSADVFRSLSGRDHPVGVGAIVRSPLVALEDFRPNKCESLFIILDRISDPGNLGTIIRTADAAGAAGVIMTGAGVDLMHPSALKASLGTAFTVPVYTASIQTLTEWKAANQVTLIGTSAKADTNYRQLNVGSCRGLLLGNEQVGLSEELAGLADDTVTIPMAGQASSLNLAVAAGILMFQFAND